MDRGRSYRLVPMARKRFKKRRAFVLLLSLGLVISIAGLTAYFIQSDRNRVEQEKTAAQHKEALRVEQALATAGEAAVPESTPTPAVPLATGTALPGVGNGQTTSKAFFQVIGSTRKAFRTIVRRNADAVGWLTIEGIVDQPVVYRDNVFYMTHDFDQQNNVCGAVFLDVNHPLRADAQNLLIYGHNMKDESMFGKLSKYMKNNFLHTHYQVTLETRFEVFTYLIFAVDRVSMNANAPNFLYFWGYPSFADQEVFQRYIDEVYRKSLYTRYLDVNVSDTLLTLVTCVGDDRLVLFARRQRTSDTDESIQKALLGLYMY